MLGLLLGSPLAGAQSTLGELLDAGAAKLTADQFKEEVVQRVLVGKSPSGRPLELMYASNGVIQGTGFGMPWEGGGGAGYQTGMWPFSGEWKFDDAGKICTQMRLGTTLLPFRCQFWFKYGERYFVSDSDWDRRTPVVSRTLQK